MSKTYPFYARTYILNPIGVGFVTNSVNVGIVTHEMGDNLYNW
jgi:hypothetical protein